MPLTRTLGAFLLAAALGSCSTTYDGSATPSQPLVMADPGQATAESPYTVEILGDGGSPLQTYDANGKFYVLGEAGARYQIHIVNPTAQRVEAVVSVDGLDVVDGEDGDLRKRGYVVPPGGDLRIEGFRTSTSEVATFRFSSVGESYASRKGKARNIGVIAVALFAEAAPVEVVAPQVIVGESGYSWDKDVGGATGGGSTGRGDSRGPSRSKGAPREYDDSLEGADGDSIGGGGATARRRPPPPPDDEVGEAEEPYQPDPCCQKSRPGLGTEYGEQRYSATTWTKFVRASETPSAVAELRYNDAGGLAALGILVGPATATPDEITTRETADPFPGDPSFSRPPAGIR